MVIPELQTVAPELAEQFCRRLAETGEFVFWLLEWDSLQPVYVSDSFSKLTGRDWSTYFSHPETVIDLIHKKDRGRLHAHLTDPAALAEVDDCFRIVLESGDCRWIRARCFSVRSEDGKVRYIGGVAEDISDMRQAQEERNKAAFVLENSPTVLITRRAGSDLHVEYVSENVSQFGYHANELLTGRVPFATLIHRDDLNRVVNELNWHASRLADQFFLDYRLITPQGWVHQVEERIRVEFGPDGDPQRYHGAIIDMTDRKEAAEKVRESESRFRMLFEISPDAAVLMDRNGVIRHVNAAMTQLTGFPSDELLGIGVADFPFLLPDEREIAQQSNRRRLAGETVPPYLLEIRTRDGEMEVVEVAGEVLRIDGKVEGVFIIARKVARPSRDSQVRHEDSDSGRPTESHPQICSPVDDHLSRDALREDCRTLLEELQVLAEAGAADNNVLASLFTTARRLDDRVSGRVATGAKQPSGNLQYISFSVRETVREAVLHMTEAARRKSLELIVYVHPEVPDRVIGDLFRFRQVLQHLLSNALRFTTEGEILVSVEIELGQKESARMLVTVSDTGPGLPDDAQEAMRDDTAPAPDSPTATGFGLGLGLAISRHLVHSMGGRLWVISPGHSSELGGPGTSFRFVMPVQPAGRGLVTRESSPCLAGYSALVADSNKSSGGMLCSLLSHWGVSTTQVSDADLAVQYLGEAEQRRRPFDLLIADPALQCQSGHSVADGISETAAASIPKLILLPQEHDGETVQWQAADPRSTAIVPKPVDSDQLCRAVTRLLLHSDPLGEFGRQSAQAGSQTQLLSERDISGQHPTAAAEAGEDWTDHTESIPVLDYRSTLRRLGGDIHLLTEFLSMFLCLQEEAVAAIELALNGEGELDRDAIESIRNGVGRLTNAAANIGALRLRDVASVVEQRLGDGRSTHLDDALLSLKYEVFIVIEEIQGVHQDVARPGLPPDSV